MLLADDAAGLARLGRVLGAAASILRKSACYGMRATFRGRQSFVSILYSYHGVSTNERQEFCDSWAPIIGRHTTIGRKPKFKIIGHQKLDADTII